VLVDPIATVPSSSIAVCSGTSFSFSPSNAIPLGTTYTWTMPTVSPNGSVTGMTNATSAQPDVAQALTNATDYQAQALYIVTPLSGACAGPNFNLVATVNPIPKLSSSLNMGLYCSGKPFSYSLNSLTPNTTYSWSRITNASISPSTRTGSSSSIAETLTNSSANPIVVVYSVVLTANTCPNPQTISVTIDPLPVANFNMVADTSGCGPITRTFVNTTTVNGAAMTTGGNFKWEVFKNGVTSALLTQPLNNYSAHLDYTFTNTGTIDSVYEVVLTAYSEHGCENVLRRKITVHPDAKAYFSVNSKAACTAFNIMLNNNLAPVNYTDANNQGTYVWTIYDKNRLAISSASSFTPPPFTISRPDDSVYVSLFVGPNYTGCRSSTYEQLLYTYENPIVNYTPSVLSGCSPLNVSVNNTSYVGKSFSVSNLTYSWYLNDIKSSILRSELFKIVNSSNTADALVNIKLVVSESIHGCKDSSSASTIRVFPQPKPDFIITKSDPVCSVAGGSLQSVDDLSSYKNSGTTQYNWSILYDGSNLPAPGVVITPTPMVKPTFLFPDNQSVSDTTYWVKLKLISVDNCVDSITRDIKLFRRPNVQFTLPVDTGCGSNNIWPIDVTTNIPESSISRVWTVTPAININNGNTKYPELIFPINSTNAAIVYAIKQKVTSFTGCTDERIRQFIVYPSPTTSFVSTSSRMDSCGPWTRVFINTSDPKNGESINDPKFNFKWSVTIGGRVVYATSDNSARNLFTYKFTNTGLVDSQYVVTLWVQTMHGCEGVYNQTYTVHPNAKSFFDGDTIGCAPFNLRTHLKVKDFPSANNPYTYEWRIYDRFGFLISRRDSIDVPNYTMLLETDTIRVQLIARSLWGCKDDIFERWVVTKSNSVKAKFISTSTSMCSDATVKLVNSSYVSSPGQSGGLTYSWFLNDDFIGNNKDTSLLLHNDYFNKDSNYIVKLVAEYSNSGCTDTLMSNLVVKPKPMANFSLTASDTCGSPLGVTRTIIDNSVAKPGNTKKIWQLYNNSLGSMSNITVDATTTANTYSFRLPDNQGLADSVFTILLNLASVDGCKADTSRKITLYRRPKAIFSFVTPNVCGQQKVQVLDATNNVANTKLWSYTSFHGGVLQIVTTTTTEPTIIVPPNTNSDEAFYFIKQIATTANGCTDSTVATLTARPVPVANFSIDRDSSCSGVLNANFTDLSYTQTAGTLITNWSWKFDDGQLDIVNRNPTHNFVSQGAYMVSLVVTDNQLCQSIPFVKKVTVYGSPTANFSFGTSKYHCLNDTIVAQNKSALGFRSTNFTSFQWDFGDGTTVPSEIAAKSPKHLYKLPGKYIVTLKVTSDSSCVIGRFTDTIFIIGPPVAGFKSDNNCVFTPVNFTDTSKAGIYDLIGAYRWSFGDGSFDNIQNPTHVFKSAGTYSVKLIVNGRTCPLLQDSTLPAHQLKIVDRRADSIYTRKYIAYNNPTTICALPAGVNYNWSPALDLSSTIISCPTINVTHRINNYLIKIIDSAGCTITDRVEIWGFMGNDIFLPRAFIPNNASVAENRILKPVYVGIKEIRYFKVFDRMGHEVFTTNSMSQYWDGTSKGKEVPTETYSWIILAIDEQGKQLMRKGNVTLIRN
jgi:gliding motility-associated-like protein